MDSLRQAGEYDIHVIGDPTSLARQIKARQPDIVLIDLANPSRDTLEELALASGPMDRPVAMFVDRSEDGLSTAAIEAGVSAYVVDGMQPARVLPVLDAAKGRNVVRLKSGDPGVFGRAGEEIAAARAAGVSIDIVPDLRCRRERRCKPHGTRRVGHAGSGHRHRYGWGCSARERAVHQPGHYNGLLHGLAASRRD